MSENKFIKKLKGEPTTGSLVEIKNASTPTSFGNMPHGTSDPIVKYSDHRGNATVVAKGTQNWKLSGSSLLLASTVNGDGNDYTDEYQASGNGLWVNATYTFPTDPNNTVSAIFNSGTKWVLKLCGHNLFCSNETVDLTLLVKIGTTNIMSKTFTVRRKALQFCEELVIDYTESLQSVIKVQGGTVLTVQVLCGDASASATIYNGMTVLTVLQRMVDANTVASDNHTFEDLEDEIADIQDEITDIHGELDGKVNIDGTSIMTAPLKFMSGSVRGAVGPYFNGVGFWKLDSQGNLTQIASISDSQFIPTTTGAISLGSSAKRFKDLYIGGTGSTIDIDGSTVWFKGYFNLRNQNQTNSLCWHAGSTSNRYAWGLNSDINNVGFQYDSSLRSFMPLIDKAESLGSASFMWKNVYTPKINNGADIAVPTSGGTMALMSDVELAANSGSQLYTTGVWYAKMYSATTVPTGAEYDGTNYADFSQVDGDNNPIIVIYEGQSGAWVQIDTITPPATYNGYLYITSKIWDIAEQTDQQGGQVLWSFSQKTFTPYPRIVSVAGLANTDLSNLSATGEARFTSKANTDLDNLTATGKANISAQGTYDANETYTAGTVGAEISNLKSYPKVYVASGFLFNSVGDTCEGYGTATVSLYPNGIARVDFNIKITTSGTSSSNFQCGLNRDLLSNINSNIPTITPIIGGSLTYYATSGSVGDNKMDYGGLMTSVNQFWQPARIYNPSGSIGGWGANQYVANQRIIGVCYGTFSV